MPHWSDNRAWRLLVPAVVVLGVVGALPLLAVIWLVRNHIARGFILRA